MTESEITFPRVTVGQLRDVTRDVAAHFNAVADTLHPAGELRDTARRMTELGTTLRTFGELLERYWTQSLTE